MKNIKKIYVKDEGMSKNRFDFYEKSSLINISNERVQRRKLVLSEKYLKKLLFFFLFLYLCHLQ